MNWSVDTNTVRRHDATGDLPPQFRATINVDQAEDPETVTLAEYRALLTQAVNNLNIPADALLTSGTRLDLSWE